MTNPGTTSTHGLADPARKIARVSFATTRGQLATIDEAVHRLGWDRSQFIRHSVFLMAESVNRAESLRDGGFLKALNPPAHAILPDGLDRT